MAERTVSVRITALVGDYQKALGQAEQSTKRFSSTTLDMARRNERHFNHLGLGAVAAGGAIAGGLGLAVKAAADYESAFAGVSKTVDGTAAQMAQLSEGIRQMATELPTSAIEIAGVAEAAGALGVKTGDILGFTRVMVDLGETTNLTADVAATSLARFMNIMGTAGTDVDELGSTLVELGNNGASTESEIMQLGLRLAGAGKQAGLSEADILGFANAMSSMGIEAEAGGSALSKVFIKINDAVIDGGETLETFAGVAGMSAEQFRSAYQDDAAGAIVSFVGGLGQIQASGQSTTAVLDSLELGEIRVADALRRTAGNSELLTQSLGDGSRAWEENIALTEEAEKRYGTSSARIEIAMNQITDAAIDIGAVLLPAVSGAAEMVGDLATSFGELPGPAKVVVAVLGSVSGGTLLVGGSILLLLPRIAATKAALDALSISGTRAGTALTGLGKAAGAAVGIGALALVVDQLWESVTALPVSVDKLTGGLIDMAAGARDSVAVMELFGDGAEGLGDTLEAANASKWDLFDEHKILQIEEARKKLDLLDQSLAGLVAGGNTEAATEALDALAQRYGLNSKEMDALTAEMPRYNEALVANANSMKLSGEAAGEAEGSVTDLAEAAGEAAGAFDKLGLSLDAASAGIDLRSSIDDLADVVDLSEEAAEAEENLADAADGLAQAGRGLADAERAVADAQEASKRAQEALTKARRDDLEAMEDLAFAAEGSVISEERAAQKLKDAQREEERTRAFSPTSRRRQDALLDLREADLADRRARDSREDSARELSEATALGPEGRVVDAKRAVEDTARGVTDAGRGLADAERAVADARAAALEAAAEVQTAIQRQDELAGAVIDVVNAAKQEVEALVASGEIADTTEAKFAALRDRLGEVADKFPALRGSIEELAGIPITVDTSQANQALDGVEARLRAIAGQIADAIKEDSTTIIARKYRSGPMQGPPAPSRDPLVVGLPKRAGGGPTMANKTYVVGENGPELWRQDSGGWVYPNDDRRTQMALGSAVPAGIMPVGGSDSGLVEAVRSLQDQVSRLGTTKTTNWNIGEVRAQDYDDFVRQTQQRERMANLAGG